VDENHDIIYKANSSSMKPMKLGIQKGVDDILREREHNTRVGWLHKNFQSFKVFPQLVSFILIFSFFFIFFLFSFSFYSFGIFKN
jgi:hypothetical protein